MKLSKQHALVLAIVAATGSAGASAEALTNDEDSHPGASESEASVLNSVTIYGEPEETSTATKLGLVVYETPQTVTVLSPDQITDFSLIDVNSVLDYVPGVTVERVETDRTYYTARGFDIVNFQYDGVGVPFSYGLTQGHDDAVIYEKVEVVKGAAGLVTGLANPSATVNYVRKRPTDENQASLSASAGSWNQARIEGDVSGQIMGDSLKGRVVFSHQDGDSYLDRYSKEVSVFYGILSGKISESSRVNVGHSVNTSHSDGMSSGALPIFYSDGSLTDYDASTNTAPAWAYQDVKQTRSFAEFEQDLNEKWMLKATYTHAVQEKEWESLYLAGNPDPNTEGGLTAKGSRYNAEDRQDIFDISLTGSFSAWGQEHELAAGVSAANIKLTGGSIYASAWDYDPIGNDWASGSTPRPAMDTYDAATQSIDIKQKQRSSYISTRLKATDDLAFLVGARAVDTEQEGISYGASQKASADDIVPYIGITYEAMPGTMLYGSYSEVFQPQTWVNSDLNPLGAVEGSSNEFGIKQEVFDGGAILTLARFESHQENFGEWIGRDAGSGLNMYRGIEIDSQGYEIELAGEVMDGLNLSAGFTNLQIDDSNGDKTRRFIPTKQFKLATAYQVPGIEGLRVGGGVRWQNEMYVGDVEVEGSYALVDLFASYQITENLTLALNVDNVGDKKYLLSPQWGQANYGEPRNIVGTVTWNY